MKAHVALVVGAVAALIASVARADEHRTLRAPRAFAGIAELILIG